MQQQRERLASSPFNDLAANQHWQEWSTKSHIMLPNYVLDHTELLRQERKRMYESPTIHQSYPTLEKTEINDAGYLEESPRKILFRYDGDSISLYENQEGLFRDYAERDGHSNNHLFSRFYCSKSSYSNLLYFGFRTKQWNTEFHHPSGGPVYS